MERWIKLWRCHSVIHRVAGHLIQEKKLKIQEGEKIGVAYDGKDLLSLLREWRNMAHLLIYLTSLFLQLRRTWQPIYQQINVSRTLISYTISNQFGPSVAAGAIKYNFFSLSRYYF